MRIKLIKSQKVLGTFMIHFFFYFQSVSPPEDLPEHGVTTVFVELDNTKIELLHPLGAWNLVINNDSKNCDILTIILNKIINENY